MTPGAAQLPRMPIVEKGREVSVRALAMIVEVLRRRDINPAPLFAGLSFDESCLRYPSERIDWDDYAVWCDRIAERVGGREGLDVLVDDIIGNSRFIAMLANQLVSIRHLYVYGLMRISRAMYAHMGHGAAVLPDGRVRLEFTIPSTHRGSMVIAANTETTFRLYPRLMGLPPARVDAQLSPHHGVYLVTPPEDRSQPARLRRVLRDQIGRLMKGSKAKRLGRALESDVDHPLLDGALTEGTARFGRELLDQRDLGALWTELARLARERLCAHRAALWVRRRFDMPYEKVGEFGAQEARPVALRPLFCSGREVGRVEVDSCAVIDVPTELDALLPWLAVAVERCLDHEERGRAPTDVGALARAWGLTPRQTEVLARLIEGASNKDVARALGCSEHTAELHVSELLRKSRCASRGALIARAWRGPG